MSEKYIWRVKYHITFNSGERNGTYDFDMNEASSEEDAERKLVQMYENDEFDLVDGEYEEGDNELVIDECSKVLVK